MKQYSTSYLVATTVTIVTVLLMRFTSAGSVSVDVTPSSYCLESSLSSIAKMTSSSKKSSETAIRLLPGKHLLDTELEVKNIYKLEMYTSSNESTVVVCKGSGTITLENISRVHIRDVVFVGCTGIEIWRIGELILENCLFRGSAESAADSAVSLSAISSAQIIETTFTSYNIDASGTLSISGGNSIFITRSRFQHNVVTGYGGGIYIIYSDNVTIDQSTFSRNNSTYQSGGCIYAKESDVAVIESTFTENTAGTDGGCIYVHTPGISSNFEVTDSTFRKNTARRYGGAFFPYYGNIHIANCIFTRNEASSGGAISTMYSNMTIDSTTFRENTAKVYYGGGLESMNGFNKATAHNAEVSIDDCTFVENTARCGGGVFVNGYIDVNIKDSTFVRNVAIHGGGVHVFYNSNLTPDRCTFHENTAKRNGGGLYADKHLKVTIDSCTFSKNTAGRNGGGFYIKRNSNASIEDSTFRLNNASGNGSCIYTSSNSVTNIDTTTQRSISRDPGCLYED